MSPLPPLREHLLSIWNAGVAAVRAPRLMQNAVQCDAAGLTLCGDQRLWGEIDRVVVVGAGKAGAGMAAALEDILGPQVVDERVCGWVNVPADCVRPLRRITLHPGRPAGVNEPTAEGQYGTERILEFVAGMQPRDLCLVLLSGGGSALLPAPIEGISLADKQAVTRFLMLGGATINELNAVRKRLSRVKGGGLARACAQGQMTTLIISDVVGDPLDVIASGPTTFDSTSPAEALQILNRFHAKPPTVPQAVFDVLESAARHSPAPKPLPANLRNVVIGNNSVALNAARQQATELGYAVQTLGSDNQGEATAIGRDLAQRCLAVRDSSPGNQSVCILSGGEPVVQLPPAGQRGKGGRNQQLVLSALAANWNIDSHNIGLLSGGTDGEDGPTDAAGAFVDAEIHRAAQSAGLDPQSFLQRCDAYPFFEQIGGLIQTGPTHTNVMDLRVALIRRDRE